MGGRGGSSTGSRGGNQKPFDRFEGGDIEMKTFNKLPKYAQDSVIAVDSYDPRSYGYNEPINYHMYYIDKDGVIQFMSEDGADFIGEVRSQRGDFGRVDDFDFPSGYQYNAGDVIPRKRN